MKRSFLLFALFALLMPFSINAQDDEVTLRLAWWGNEDRHNMYNELADEYEAENESIAIEREFADWGPYWERLATQVAGGNMPDVIHQHPTYINEYASRGTLLDLTPLVEDGTIDLSQFSQGVIDSGTVDGRIYMITLGNSAPGVHYNTAMLEEAGVEFDPNEWTWETFMDVAMTLTEELGEDVYGTGDAGAADQPFEVFMNQRGKSLFEGDGLGFEREDLRAWWAMWEELRTAGAIPPADVWAELPGGISSPESPLVQGFIVMDFVSGNQHAILQQYMEDELGLAVIPRTEGGVPGDVIGGAYMSISANTEHVEEAAEFINWFINDPDVAIAYGAEHGPPGSAEMQDVVRPTLDDAMSRVLDHMATVGPTSSLRAQRPEGGNEVIDAFSRIYDELAFGRVTLDEAVDMFFEEADFILG